MTSTLLDTICCGVLPLYFGHRDSFWREEPAARGVVLGILREMRAWDVLDEIVAVSDEPGLADFLAEHGEKVLLVASGPDLGTLLPRGSRAALRAVCEAGLTGAYLLRDVRRVRVSRDAAREFVRRRQGDPGRAWVSLAVPEDHPVQMYLPLRAEVPLFIHRFAADQPGGGGPLATVPCCLPVPGLDAVKAAGRFWSATSLGGGIPEPLPSLDAVHAGGVVAADFDRYGLCSLFFPREIPTWADFGELDGRSLPWPGLPQAALVRDSGGWKVVMSDTHGEASREGRVLVVFQGAAATHELAFTPGMEMRLPEEPQGEGLFCVLVSSADGPEGAVDIRLPFAISHGGWKVLPGQGVYDINEQRMVSGRQTFPVCWECDGALAMGSAEALAGLERGMARGEVKGVALDGIGPRIESRIEYLMHGV